MKSTKRQVGGSHYKKYRIQPAEYTFANRLGHHEGVVVYYVTRWRDKNGVQDLEKAIHHLQLMIDMERKYNTLDDAEDDLKPKSKRKKRD
jgi:hypothetical protein